MHPLRSLPEIFCLWASEPYSLLCHNIKYLAGKIRKGNWATPWNARWPLPLFAFDEDAAGKVGVELTRQTWRTGLGSTRVGANFLSPGSRLRSASNFPEEDF